MSISKEEYIAQYTKKIGEISYYSQSGEDKYLNDNYFKNRRGGIFLEMGALDGLMYSNTKFFEDSLGWAGILVEPHPNEFKNLKLFRPNCQLYNNIVSDSTEKVNFLFFEHSLSAISGIVDTLSEGHFKNWFDNEKNSDIQQICALMEPVSLTEIIKTSGVDHIDFFSLDVEGHELNVLRSYDFSIPIYLILIECLDQANPNEIEISNLLKKNGFILVDKIAHNNIWINEKELSKI